MNLAPLACLALAAAAVGCSPADAEGDGLLIVTTVSPITNLAANVGGEHVHVTALVPEGANSHTFEPAPSDAVAVADADAVFLNGLGLEQPVIDLIEDNAPDDAAVVSLGDRSIDPSEYIYDFSFPRSGGSPNPHLWTEPSYAARYARTIAATLTELDPEHRRDYQANLARLLEQIDVLERALREATDTVAPARRKLLTYHDSFPYFARAYGWEVVGAVQPADFAEPSPSEVARLIEQVRETDVPALFGSAEFPSPVLEQIAAESGATYIDDLRDDDLPGSAGDARHSYVGLMVFDYSTIVRALGGDASELEALDTSNVVAESNVEYRE